MKKHYEFKLLNIGCENDGFLVPLNHMDNIPFEVKRIFCIYGIKSKQNRGEHAYYYTKQVLICISGNLKIKCFDGKEEKIYKLNSLDQALYVSPKVWRSTFEHSIDLVLLVLLSIEYNENDYMRDYDKFLDFSR